MNYDFNVKTNLRLFALFNEPPAIKLLLNKIKNNNKRIQKTKI